MLDFDFEKLCSVSLSHINVYACLVCGKYFQGEYIITYGFIILTVFWNESYQSYHLQTKKRFLLKEILKH